MKSCAGVSLGPMALQILTYLKTHRSAQDTVEGIAEWWLLEQRVRNVITEVKRALAKLVAQGLVVERSGRDGRIRYRLNPRKRNAITRCVRKLTSASAPTPNGASPPASSLGGTGHG